MDVHHSDQAQALYIGPRYYFSHKDDADDFTQLLFKYASALSKESGDKNGTFKERTLGALYYLGRKRKTDFVSTEFNVGIGMEFYEFEHSESYDGMTGAIPFEYFLIDVNFCIGFHT